MRRETVIYPIILSGGSGARLWPLSREHYPKQLLPLVSDRTLLQEATTRLDGMENVADPLIVCNEEHRFLVADQIREIDKKPSCIILEPAGRNTAPAMTLAALALRDRGGNALLLVMPSDHHMGDKDTFQASVEQAAPLALHGKLVTFGIKPVAAATGYGYIRCGDRPHEVAAFVEKPDLDTAREYIKSGRYLWNSGMFMMRPSVWLEELGRHRPEIIAACERAFQQGKKDGDFFRVEREAFMDCVSDSIDYAVMEKTELAAVVPLAAGWSDVGSWSSFWDVSPQDEDGNVISGDAFAHNSKNCVLISQSRLLAAVGLHNMILVETPDAVLAVPKDQAQSVRAVVDWLKSQGREEHKMHRRVYRPWGHYEGLDAGKQFQVKRLTINPGAVLSLQLHHQRAEHWVVVKGTARVTRGDEVSILAENESTYIPVGMKHRIENPGSTPLEVIEVQSGDYLGEDDIVRFEDKYHRA
jgi:mannose-1-phosphate guanylyltransferase/mannose-6-phosphate isomerase